MVLLSYSSRSVLPYQLGLVLIVVANVGFHTMDSLIIYFWLCITAMLLIATTELSKFGMVLYKEKCITYLTVLYVMYTFYGAFFTRKGIYNWDFMLFTYAQNICLYISMRRLLSQPKWLSSLATPFIVSSFFILVYLVVVERDFIFVSHVETRVGNTLSGNVNTVGSALGIISFVLTAYYSITKRKKVFYVLVPLLILMLLTGSKKTVIIIVIDVFTIYVFARNKASAFYKACLIGAILLWIVIESSYFHDVLGKRIEDMYTTMTGFGGGSYSHSTDAREGMIIEAFKLFFNYPILGGGMNYFSYASLKYGYYGYSHCNYTELLCNFGIVGFLLYYIPYLKNVLFLWRTKEMNWMESIFGIIWLAISFVIGWATVQFSDRCISYIPIIGSYALIESIKRKHVCELLEHRLLISEEDK